MDPVHKTQEQGTFDCRLFVAQNYEKSDKNKGTVKHHLD
jgi:hypothetical protein